LKTNSTWLSTSGCLTTSAFFSTHCDMVAATNGSEFDGQLPLAQGQANRSVVPSFRVVRATALIR
jgi:hypothetical protein